MLKKGVLTYVHSEPASAIYLQRIDQAKTVRTNRSGNQRLLHLRLSSSVMDLTVLASTAVRDAEAVAITDVTQVGITRERFQ